jgi:hypothetical protein
VYWVRRLLLAALVGLVVVLVWWLLPGGGSPRAAGDPNAPSGHPAGQHLGGGPAGSALTNPYPTAHHPASSPRSTDRSEGSTTPSTKPSTTPSTSPPSPTASGSPLVPTGACVAATLHLGVEATPMRVGGSTTVDVSLWTPDGSTCSLALSPQLLEAQVTSSSGAVWQSTTCPDALPARNVVVGPTERSVYTFSWNGRHGDGCGSGGAVVPAGGYWLEAALVGGNPDSTYLSITSS